MADFTAQALPVSLTSVTPDSADASVVTPTGGGMVLAIYAQRVFSSGLGVWCYYTDTPNSSPAPGATTPNWTGSLAAYEIISGRLN